jgi:hypothetical protein
METRQDTELGDSVNWKPTIEVEPTIEIDSVESEEEEQDDTIEYFEDRYYDYDATEEGKITIGSHILTDSQHYFTYLLLGGSKTLQPHKVFNEAGSQKLDHVLQERKITVDCTGTIKEQSRKDDARRIRNKEKSNRATSEQGKI